ncbi:MAG: hypothetical protein IKU34_10725 [Clostridia bacterium]|nr:hypothetical protein [Clostridia bacterium]
MLEQLTAAWPLRRVLIAGSADAMTRYAAALLTALGAQTVCLPPDAGAFALHRALSAGRIHAVLIPAAHALFGDDDLPALLRSLFLLFGEIREAGVPLVILCSDEDVYAPNQSVPADELAPLGGRTRAGMHQSIIQLAASGFSRGLMGDPVRTVICRHAPCLGSGHADTAQYSAWCRAILQNSTPVIEHPDTQGTFLHPLDAMLGALCLGAHHLLNPQDAGGIYNLGDVPKSRCANRSAWQLLAAAQGSARPCRHAHPPRLPARNLLDGSRARALCGYRVQLGARQALSFLMEHEKAQRISEEAAAQTRLAQAQALLDMLS